MHTNKYFLVVLFFLAAITSVSGQQSVDLSQLDNAYKGPFFKVGFGIANGNAGDYGITPLHLDLEAGKRLSRGIAPYFDVHSNFLIKEDNLSSYQETGVGVGINFYSKKATTYLAPEISFSTVNYKTKSDVSDSYAGVNLTLKSGWDMHITGHVFGCVEAMLSYIAADWKGFLFGANLYLKIGK